MHKTLQLDLCVLDLQQTSFKYFLDLFEFITLISFVFFPVIFSFTRALVKLTILASYCVQVLRGVGETDC